MVCALTVEIWCQEKIVTLTELISCRFIPRPPLKTKMNCHHYYKCLWWYVVCFTPSLYMLHNYFLIENTVITHCVNLCVIREILYQEINVINKDSLQIIFY